jgi:hypothetical protein
MTAFYERLLSLLPRTAIGGGEMEFCETGLPHCFAMKWKNASGQLGLALVNLAPQRAGFQIQGLQPGGEWAEVWREANSAWSWQGGCLHIDFAAHGFALLAWRPVIRSA